MEEGLKALTEATPLVGTPVTASKPKAERKWKNSWIALFGDGSPADISAACLSYNAPCVAFGWNQNRAMQLSFWKELARFVLFTMGSFFLVHMLSCLTLMIACPPPPGDRRSHGPWEHDSETETDTDMEEHGRSLLHEYPHDADFHHPHGADFHSPECMMKASPALLGVLAIAIALIAYFVYFAAKRRQALRERFGIEGTLKSDVALWACCSLCALSQETRTLMHEQVHEGIWHGPHPAYAQTGVPVQQAMAV